MNIFEYHRLAMRTSPDDGHDKIDNGILGLIEETGEVVGVYKKYMYQSSTDAELPVGRFAEELGDVLWYLAELADGMGEKLFAIAGADFDQLDRAAAGKELPTLRSAVTELPVTAVLIAKAPGNARARELMNDMIQELALTARILGLTIGDIAERNIAKQQARYPNGFDPRISEARYE